MSAPIAITLGLDVPFDRVQELARCEKCGRRGAHTTGPSFAGMDVDWLQFPAARPSGRDGRSDIAGPYTKEKPRRSGAKKRLLSPGWFTQLRPLCVHFRHDSAARFDEKARDKRYLECGLESG